METGLVHIYCGDGKGKTTAAMGLTLRCNGGGGEVLLFQFLKSGRSSEMTSLELLPHVTVLEAYTKIKFAKYMTEEEKEEAKAFYTKRFEEIIEEVQSKEYKLLVLDEAIGALNLGYISEERMLEFLQNKPAELEVVLTGRNPSEKMMAAANYVSKIEKIKHPFDQGIEARKLIEW